MRHISEPNWIDYSSGRRWKDNIKMNFKKHGLASVMGKDRLRQRITCCEDGRIILT
jgi:hypothetical protein